MSKNVVVKMTDVCKSYDNVTNVLDNINLEITKGEFVYIIGESGAGKSTFLKLLYREENLSSGDIEVLGRNVSEIKNNKIYNLRRDLGCVFQDFKLLDNLTVFENIRFVLEVVGCKKDEIESKVMEVLTKMKISDKRDNYPNELSGGQQQRVAIARALVNKPDLLICDEPTGNLDPSTGNDIFKEILEINKEGTTVIMTTHNKELVNKYRNRLIKLENGVIISDEVNGVYEDIIE